MLIMSVCIFAACNKKDGGTTTTSNASTTGTTSAETTVTTTESLAKDLKDRAQNGMSEAQNDITSMMTTANNNMQ